MLQKIKDFVDQIFGPPIAFLDMAKDKLVSAASVTARGLNVRGYLSVFGDMPGAWQAVVSSLLVSVVLIIGLLIFRSAWRMYFAVKGGVKWW